MTDSDNNQNKNDLSGLLINDNVIEGLKMVQEDGNYVPSLSDIGDMIARMNDGVHYKPETINLALANVAFFKEMLTLLSGEDCLK